MIATDTAAPYETNWIVTNGAHTLSAVVFTDDGLSSSPSNVSITGVENTAPQITSFTPVDNSTYTIGKTITLTATAADAEGNIDFVEFYLNGSEYAVDDAEPYSAQLPVTSGTFTIQAKAVDKKGLEQSSSIHSIQGIANTAPELVMTSPASGSVYDEGDTVELAAIATDAENNIDRVTFYVNGAQVGSDSSSPYSRSWDAVAGTHSITAVVTDDDGLTDSVQAYSISVNARTMPLPKPASLTITPPVNSGGYTVKWPAVPGAAYFEVYGIPNGNTANCVVTNCLEKSGPGRQILWGWSTPMYQPGSHRIEVRACDSTGNWCSEKVTGTVHVLDPSALVPPVDIEVSPTPSFADYSVDWTAIPAANSYTIGGIPNGVLSNCVNIYCFELVTTSPSFSSSQLTAPMRSAGTHEIWIWSCRNTDGTDCSDVVIVNHTVMTTGQLAQPTGFQASPNPTSGDYTVSWNAVGGAKNYVVSAYPLGSASDCSHYYCLEVITEETSFNSADLRIELRAPGTHEFWISACDVNNDNCSAVSVTTVQVLSSGITAPTNLTISNSTENYDGDYTISWDSVPGAYQYWLQGSVDGQCYGGIPCLVSNTTSTSVNSASLPQAFRDVGTHSFAVSACSDAQCTEIAASELVEITILSETRSGYSAETAPLPANKPNFAALASSDAIGTTAGSFRVNETGAATYEIPIAVPPGTAGVVPQLSFNYSSQGGNGVMGQGWSLGGLSAISRCRQTLHQDRSARPISWSEDDRFCLDGQRLVLDDPINGVYGAPGSVYRTEIDSFARVTAEGGTLGHPKYFTVERKDGSTSYYGETDTNSEQASKLKNGAGDTLTWTIRKFEGQRRQPDLV